MSTIECGNCGEPAPTDATWCEACGHELGIEPKPACVSCGEREVDVEEGYCHSCGYRQPRERDHLVVEDGPMVAISDRGRRHHHNEDAVALGLVRSDGIGTGGTEAMVLVVCDGVSSTPGSAEASAGAAVAARDHLVAALSGQAHMAEVPNPRGSAPPADPVDKVADDPADSVDPSLAAGDEEWPERLDGGSPLDVTALLIDAVAAAQSSAAASPGPDISAGSDGPPSSTLVAVVIRPGPGAAPGTEGEAWATESEIELATAWVGDSRAYWVTDDDAVALSGPDHELAGSLVRWLGADSLDPTPDIDVRTITGGGHLVVCTDGLWRYASEPVELGVLLRRLVSEGLTGTSLAEGLVDHANEGGGHDNITVALWSNQPDWPADVTTHPSIASAVATDPER
jgi:serine/threonine protein phosphatase PrpC/ribosomal protein L37E